MTDKMTATETFRQLLDERGVEWWPLNDVESGYYEDRDTEFIVNGCKYVAYEWSSGLQVDMLTPEQAIEATLGQKVTGQTSDGYHTFDELYHHRAVLFSVIVRDHQELAWKSKEHHDGTMYDGMFIVGIETPEGQATYHYDIDPYWDMFDCKELDRAPEWDGHTPDEAIERIGKLATLGRGTCRRVLYKPTGVLVCSECGAGMPKQLDKYCYLHYCPNCGRRVECEQ